MTTALAHPDPASAERPTAAATRSQLHIVVRPAPQREPPFDDEVIAPSPVTPWDQRLPFERRPAPITRLPLRTRPRGLPDPAIWGRRLLIGLIEAADGRRPLPQLAAMLSPSVTRGLATDFDRTAQSGAPHWLHRTGVRTVRAAEPVEGVAELCATLEADRRVRAVAMRLEEQHGRWRCTRLQLG